MIGRVGTVLRRARHQHLLGRRRPRARGRRRGPRGDGRHDRRAGPARRSSTQIVGLDGLRRRPRRRARASGPPRRTGSLPVHAGKSRRQEETRERELHMAEIEFDDVVKRYPDGFEAVKHLNLEITRRRAARPRRPLGVREVDRAAHDRRARGHLRGRPEDRRGGRQRPRAQGSRHRDGLPELRPVPAHERARQHGLRAEAAQGEARGDQPPRDRGGQDPRPRAAPRPQARQPLRRPAPARGHGPRDRARARRPSSWTSRCPTSTPSCASRCAPRSRACSSAWTRPPST